MIRHLLWPHTNADTFPAAIGARWAHGISYFLAYCGSVVAYMGFIVGENIYRVFSILLSSILIAILGCLIRYFIGKE